MSYFKMGDGVVPDNLIGDGAIQQFVSNVALGSGVSVERGDLLAKSGSVYIDATGSEDVFAIAYSPSASVATVYESGCFNVDALNYGSSVDIDSIEDKLRNQGIYLTKSMEVE